jgi:hypothetical protein
MSTYVIFVKLSFQVHLAPNELMLDFLRDHVYWAVSGKHVNVLNLIEMFFDGYISDKN